MQSQDNGGGSPLPKKPLSIRERKERERIQYGENVMRMFRIQGADFSDDQGKFSGSSGKRIACRILMSCPKCTEPSVLYTAGVCFEPEEGGFDQTAHAHVMCENEHEGTIYFVGTRTGNPLQIEVTFERKKDKGSNDSHGKKLDLAELKMIYNTKPEEVKDLTDRAGTGKTKLASFSEEEKKDE